MGKSAPAAPDYTGAAEASGEASREVTEAQTWANRPNQYTPYGSQQWSNEPMWDPTTGQYVNQWTQQTYLTDESQRALDAQLAVTTAKSELGERLTGRMEDEFGEAYDPSGLPEWAQTPDVPDYWKYYQAGPEGGQYDEQAIQMGVDFSGLDEVEDFGTYRTQAEEAIYGKGASRLDPRMETQRNALRSELYNQGLREGDEAFQQRMGEFEDTRTDAYGQLSMDAIMGGGAEAQRQFGADMSRRGQGVSELMGAGGFANQAAQQALAQQLGIGGQEFSEAQAAQQQRTADMLNIGGQQFGQDMSAAGYQNTLRQAQLAEDLQRRGMTLNEINAIMSGQQVGMPQMPGFNQAQRAESTDYLGAAGMQGQAALDAWNAEQAATQGMMSGIGDLAGGAMMFSDRRLKTNIHRIDNLPSGLPLYAYRYIWGGPTRLGVMADEVRMIFPEAVISVGGYDMVDYSKVM